MEKTPQEQALLKGLFKTLTDMQSHTTTTNIDKVIAVADEILATCSSSNKPPETLASLGDVLLAFFNKAADQNDSGGHEVGHVVALSQEIRKVEQRRQALSASAPLPPPTPLPFRRQAVPIKHTFE